MANRQSYSNLWIHVIWATKYRESLISKEIKYLLYDYIREICRELDYHLDFINGVEDHVHLLFSLNPVHSISDMVKNIKGKSWAWMLKQNLIEDYFTWQDGYSAFSVSPQNVQRVRNYIKNQEKHHSKYSYEQEIDKINIDSFKNTNKTLCN